MRPRRTPYSSLPSVLLLVVGASACSFAPDPVAVPAVDAMPASFSEDAAEPVQPTAGWWTTFEDETLDDLVVSALESNHDITEAIARIDEVRAQYRIARSPLFPSVTAGADASRFSQPANAGQFGAIFGGGEGEGEEDPSLPERPSRFTFSTFGVSLAAAYELDFWGRLNSGRRAAMADYLATAADARTVQISVVAETIATYFELRELIARADVLEEVIDILGERLELTEDRYQRGVSTSIELYQIQQDLNNSLSGLPLLRSQLVSARGRLAVLLGRYPAEVDPMLADGGIPLVSLDPIPAGLPSEMLTERPDLQSAALRLEATRQRVGERRAARLPSINLTGSTGTQSSDLSNIIRADQWFTNFVASLTAPIFSGGRLKAEQEGAEARYAQEAARYARSVLTAFQEVDAALAAFNAQRERTLILDDQLSVAQASADAAQLRVEQGVGDYVGYLDALRTVLNVQDTRATAERDLATARLNVHRALGGAWIDEAAENPDMGELPR